jgi:AcrR family transcriptional regulator
MPIVDSQAEQQIKETAMRIFFVEGRLRATTPVIAKEAGVNRGLIYYYFESRDKLFEVVFREAVLVVRNRMQELFMSSRLSFRKKISEFIDVTIDQSLKYPYLHIFLISEMNKDSSDILVPLRDDLRKELLQMIEQDLKKEIANGSVPKMSPEQFLINVMSMCIYPILYKPMMLQMINISDSGYMKMIQERKSLIMKVLFRD